MDDDSDKVTKYVDNDNYSFFDFTQPLSAYKKRQYKLQDAPILGKGSFGTVVRSTWKPTFHLTGRKDVALKIVSKDPPRPVSKKVPNEGETRTETEGENREAKKKIDEAKEAHRKRVRNEIAILTEVEHENLVGFYDCFESKANFYISTELLYGEELLGRLQRLSSFTEADAINITRSIIQGVKFLHDKSIVHMDIKPENIVFRSTDNMSDLAIVDFGFARKLDEEILEVPWFPSRGKYIAPEILEPQKYEVVPTYERKTDMWSVGIIVYMLLIGKFPFDGSTDDDEDEDRLYCKNVLRRKVKYSSKIWKDVSPTAMRFTRSLLHKGRTRRSSAEDALKHEWLTTFRPENKELEALRTNSQRRDRSEAARRAADRARNNEIRNGDPAKEATKTRTSRTRTLLSRFSGGSKSQAKVSTGQPKHNNRLQKRTRSPTR